MKGEVKKELKEEVEVGGSCWRGNANKTEEHCTQCLEMKAMGLLTSGRI